MVQEIGYTVGRLIGNHVWPVQSKSKRKNHEMWQIFARYLIPLELVTDNSPFNSAEFKAFAGRWEFIHTTSSPHYAESNGHESLSCDVYCV